MSSELDAIESAIGELRSEVKSAKPDAEKLERMNAFISDYEEKVAQPIVRAQEEAKNLKENYAELQARMELSGVAHSEAKERVEALELAAATRHAQVDSEDPNAYKSGEEFKAMSEWVREGDLRISSEVKALLRTDVQGDGGYLVPEEMDSAIVKKITEIDPIRSIARVRTIGSKSISLPVRDSIPVATYEGEGEAGAESASAYRNENVVPYRQTFTTPITRDMLMDSAFDMDSEIMGDAGEAFAFGGGNGYVVGTGDKQPSGFAANATLQAAARPSGVSADIAPENLISLTGDLKEGYDPVYVLNRRTLARIRTFRSDSGAGAGTGSFLWSPGLNGPTDATLNGFRYIIANSMPDIGADAFCVAFGDFRRGYTIVDRMGLEVIRDDFTKKTQAIVEFTLHRWNTGQVTLTEPIKLLQCDS